MRPSLGSAANPRPVPDVAAGGHRPVRLAGERILRARYGAISGITTEDCARGGCTFDHRRSPKE